ncbi:MAG: pyridoxal phosphate-dependent aminotransferase [Flavobacteriales bacterium]|nr:pyridoxal phosphate-dependent aminotransferase [Flavobacteriales bacterium]MCX7651166.1 pyridoxal phosphate-dependent aminotransferase [Flavobacteriales bacterium]MDW8432790.1 pyridoxal phosphate-dependent aminotransferase [Flavobacteriales bacterium]
MEGALAERVRLMGESETLAMARMARELKNQGRHIINLSLGEPDFDTPEIVKEAAIQAIRDNYSHYTPVPGYLELQEAVCEKLWRDNGLRYEPHEIVCTTGAKQAIANAVTALLNPGDEVLLPTPYWVSYREMVRFAGGRCVFVKAGPESGYKTSADALRPHIHERTRLIIFSSPCNPSGAVWSDQELEDWAALLKEFPQLFVISDEIYEHIYFTPQRPGSLARFPEIRDRVITVNGLSKGFAMTGWRFGYSASHSAIAKACVKIMGQYTSATCSITQRAAITALRTPPDKIVKPMTEAFRKRRDLLAELLKSIPGLKFLKPEGAFYIFADASFYLGTTTSRGAQIRNSQDLCMFLLNEAGVAITPGTAFGMDDHIRFSFAASEADLEESVGRCRHALEKLPLLK